ncbi:MAG: mechanosensitive ion channel domain-containing protein [Candidatus Reddybacter sp.]
MLKKHIPFLLGGLRSIEVDNLESITATMIASLGQIGIQTASFVAIVGAAGLAVGLAMQSSLSNFAAGVLIIIFKLFKIGDFVEMAGTSGVIENIINFATEMKTGDNIKIIVPNS